MADTESTLPSEKTTRQDSAYYHYYRGLLQRKAGNLDLATAHFSRVIELDPTYSEAYFYRGQCFRTLGVDSLAERDFHQCGILLRNKPELHHYLYNILLNYVRYHLPPEELRWVILSQPPLTNSENDAAEESVATLDPDPATFEKTEKSDSNFPNTSTSRTIIPYQNNRFQLGLFNASAACMIVSNVTPALTNSSTNQTCEIPNEDNSIAIDPKMYSLVLAAAASILTSICVLFYFIYYRNQPTNNNVNPNVERDRNAERYTHSAQTSEPITDEEWARLLSNYSQPNVDAPYFEAGDPEVIEHHSPSPRT